MAKKLTGIIALWLVLTVSALPGCAGDAGPQVGKTPPDFKLSTLDGRTVSLRDFRGSPVMLNFWASWCPPCRYEMPFFQQIWEEWHGKGLVILAMNIGETAATAQKFMDDSGFTFPVLLDSDQDVALNYNIRSIPTTFFLDEAGVIRDMKIGAFINKSSVESKLSRIIR